MSPEPQSTQSSSSKEEKRRGSNLPIVFIFLILLTSIVFGIYILRQALLNSQLYSIIRIYWKVIVIGIVAIPLLTFIIRRIRRAYILSWALSYNLNKKKENPWKRIGAVVATVILIGLCADALVRTHGGSVLSSLKKYLLNIPETSSPSQTTTEYNTQPLPSAPQAKSKKTPKVCEKGRHELIANIPKKFKFLGIVFFSPIDDCTVTITFKNLTNGNVWYSIVTKEDGVLLPYDTHGNDQYSDGDIVEVICDKTTLFDVL